MKMTNMIKLKKFTTLFASLTVAVVLIFSLGATTSKAEEVTHDGTIVITKTDSKTGDTLSGATFEVKGVDENVIGTYTTGEDGTVTVSGLEAGTYVVTETEAPKGYNISEESQNATVTESQGAYRLVLEWQNAGYEDLGMPGGGAGCTCTPDANCGCYDEYGNQDMTRCTCGGGMSMPVFMDDIHGTVTFYDSTGAKVDTQINIQWNGDAFEPKENGYSFVRGGTITATVSYDGLDFTVTDTVPYGRYDIGSQEDSKGGQDAVPAELTFADDPVEIVTPETTSDSVEETTTIEEPSSENETETETIIEDEPPMDDGPDEPDVPTIITEPATTAAQGKAPKTADSTDIAIYIILMGAALASGIIVAAKRRNNQ